MSPHLCLECWSLLCSPFPTFVISLHYVFFFDSSVILGKKKLGGESWHCLDHTVLHDSGKFYTCSGEGNVLGHLNCPRQQLLATCGCRAPDPHETCPRKLNFLLLYFD